MRFNTIIIANIAEAFEGVINKARSNRERQARIGVEHGLCDRTFLWGGDNKVVVTPFPISQPLLKKNLKVFSFENVINISPRCGKVSLSDSIQENKELLKILVDIIRDNPGIDLSPYCITEKFLSLAGYLKNIGLSFSVKQMPVCHNPNWLVSYLDSKVGSRMEIGKIRHESVRTPESIVCRNQKEAADAFAWFYEQGRSCVAKADFGESGWGTMILPRERFESVAAGRRQLAKGFEADFIWHDGLILIEEYIESDGLNGVAPSSELYLDDHGPKITYLCDQVMGENKVFLGVALGLGVLSSKVRRKMSVASIHVGNRFWEMGYRGFFDIDFVVSKTGDPFIIETNMRRTGGTYVYDTVRSLRGKKWESEVAVLSQDSFKYGSRRMSEEEILGRMKDILYSENGRQKGIIVSIINKKQPTFGFIIIERSRQSAIRMYNEMLRCFDL